MVLERRPGDDIDEEVDEWEWRKRIFSMPPAARIVAELVALVVIGRPRRPDGGE